MAKKKFQDPSLEQQRQNLNVLQRQLDIQKMLLKQKNLQDKINMNQQLLEQTNTHQPRLTIENGGQSQASKIYQELKKPTNNIFSRLADANKNGGGNLTDKTFHLIIDDLRKNITIPPLKFFRPIINRRLHPDGTDFNLITYPYFWNLFQKVVDKIENTYGVKENMKIVKFNLEGHIVDSSIFWNFFILISIIFYYGPNTGDWLDEIQKKNLFSGNKAQKNFLIQTFRKLLTYCLKEQRNFFKNTFKCRSGEKKFIKVKNSSGKLENLDLLDPDFNSVLNIFMQITNKIS